jgi:purine-nucleoside phosphorylase
VYLAREAGLHYAGLSIVTNLGAGLTPEPVAHDEVESAMKAAAPRIQRLILEAVTRVKISSLPKVGPGVDLPDAEV